VCECIKITEKALCERYKDPHAAMQTAVTLSDIEYPAMHATIRPLKTNGTPGVRQTQILVIPTYCPFCGKKYKED